MAEGPNVVMSTIAVAFTFDYVQDLRAIVIKPTVCLSTYSGIHCPTKSSVHQTIIYSFIHTHIFNAK